MIGNVESSRSSRIELSHRHQRSTSTEQAAITPLQPNGSISNRRSLDIADIDPDRLCSEMLVDDTQDNPPSDPVPSNEALGNSSAHQASIVSAQSTAPGSGNPTIAPAPSASNDVPNAAFEHGITQRSTWPRNQAGTYLPPATESPAIGPRSD